MKFIFKLLTAPFWFPFWLWKTSIKLAFFCLLMGAVGGWFYYSYM